jgi:KUP system potassium uptake protein
MDTSFFLSRERIVATAGRGRGTWSERFYSAMARNAGSVTDYFNIPPNRVVELGTRVEI